MLRRWSYALLVLILAAPTALLAQGEAGLKGGVSFGNISNKGLLPGNLKTRTGFAAGIYAGYRVGFFGVGLDALYAQRGASSDSSFATAQTKLDYVDVPVYLKVFVPAPLIQPFIYAGPQVSFEARCRMANGSACPDAASSGRRKTDYAGVIGAGLRFGGLGLEGRYVYGLRDLKISTATDPNSYKTRTFLILVNIGRT
ncbi:MAG TPA: porin family protein [Gemmatimonadales bacterium]|jgi:hypothetical protein|nr:porin family protein [Gemmatimonadales bacterium]